MPPFLTNENIPETLILCLFDIFQSYLVFNNILKALAQKLYRSRNLFLSETF